jgi:hypothetical protein
MQLPQGELCAANVLEYGLEDGAVTRAIHERQLLGDSDDVNPRQRPDIDVDDVRPVAPRSASDVSDRRRRRESRHELRDEVASARRAVRQRWAEQAPMALGEALQTWR